MKNIYPYTVVHAVLPENLSDITDWFRDIVLKLMRYHENIGLDWSQSQVFIVTDLETKDNLLIRYATTGIETVPHEHLERAVHERRKEFLECQGLPIYGRRYPIVSSGQALKDNIYFVITAFEVEKVFNVVPDTWLLLNARELVTTVDS